MKGAIKEILWEDLKDDFKFFIKNFREIIKKTWYDLIDDFKYG